MILIGVLYLLNERSMMAEGRKAKSLIFDSGFSRGVLGAQVSILTTATDQD